jgi:hypothetical protein
LLPLPIVWQNNWHQKPVVPPSTWHQQYDTLMSQSTRVLIAGGGSRVSTFVVPALLALGISRKDIVIFKRSPSEPEGAFEGIMVTDRKDALAESYGLIINCMTESRLLDMQRRLVRQFPKAVHFCDMPVLKDWTDLPQLVGLGIIEHLFSLEDWPSLPNLAPLIDFCRMNPNSYQLRFERLDDAVHFLSAARTAAAAAGVNNKRIIRRTPGVLVDKPIGTRAMCILEEPPDVSKSKIVAWNEEQLIEDYFEVYDGRGPDPQAVSDEVIYRRVDGDRIRYFLGHRCFRQVEMPRAIIDSFLGRGARGGAQGLDKCVSLMDIFGSALEGRIIAYRYSLSARDATAMRLARTRLNAACIV